MSLKAYFQPLTIDLTTTFTDKEYNISGKALFMLTNHKLLVRLDNINNPQVDLFLGKKIYCNFKKFYLTNPIIQQGNAILLIGYGDFDVEPRFLSIYPTLGSSLIFQDALTVNPNTTVTFIDLNNCFGEVESLQFKIVYGNALLSQIKFIITCDGQTSELYILSIVNLIDSLLNNLVRYGFNGFQIINYDSTNKTIYLAFPRFKFSRNFKLQVKNESPIHVILVTTLANISKGEL